VNEPCESVTARGSAAELALPGELDLASIDDVLALVRSVLAGAPTELVLDVSAVAFIDCAGLSVLFAAVEVAERAGCRVRLSRLSEPVRRLLTLTGELDHFDIGPA
jgi:anti-anti-sigma factor